MSDFVTSVCFPLSDLRAFGATAPARNDRPDWLFPQPGHDFVRGCGAIRKRREGEIPGWPGSRYFCRAQQMVKFCDPETSRFEHTFKRLFFDGTCVGNVHIGLVKRGPPALERVLGMSVRTGRNKPRPLVTIGGSLADRFLDATTGSAHRGDPDARLVEGGDPVMICEFGHEDGADALAAAIGGPLPVLDWPVLGVFYGEIRLEGVNVPVWLLARRGAMDDEAAPRLQGVLCTAVRNLLIRRHCERAALGETLRAMRRGAFAGAANVRLEKFLLATIGKLSARPDEAVVAGLRLDPTKAARAGYGELHGLALATVLSAEEAAMARDEELVVHAIEVMGEHGFPAELVDSARGSLDRIQRNPPRPAAALNREQSLHKLLLSLFDGEELRRFLALGFPEIEAELPGAGASPASLAFEGMKAIQRRRGGADELFAALLSARSLRAADIEAVYVLWRDAGRA